MNDNPQSLTNPDRAKRVCSKEKRSTQHCQRTCCAERRKKRGMTKPSRVRYGAEKGGKKHTFISSSISGRVFRLRREKREGRDGETSVVPTNAVIEKDPLTVQLLFWREGGTEETAKSPDAGFFPAMSIELATFREKDEEKASRREARRQRKKKSPGQQGLCVWQGREKEGGGKRRMPTERFEAFARGRKGRDRRGDSWQRWI